ncbi:MAG: thermonuclease family protein [Candidatus Avelusimicrobium sp.]|uniref:thermonuclease family protein n=1 Tax=Candidatus Avelusimicrobium sp. TaxID=3048833 RepID=UPI003F0CE754
MCFSLCLNAQPLTSNFYKVKLGKVIDGDTFKVYLSCSYKVFCKSASVRVRGIDTPELKSKDPAEKERAKQARAFTREFLTGRKITLKQCEKDKYFRLLCDVYADSKSLSEALLSENLAVPYNGGKK